MALPDCDRCHSCFSIFTSPAATPSSIVADVTASHTPETCGPAAVEPAFAVAGRRATHPAAFPIDASARATLKKPTKPERIRTKTSRRCHLRFYTIKLGSDARRATPNLSPHAGGCFFQSIGGCRRLVEDGCARRLPLRHPLR